MTDNTAPDEIAMDWEPGKAITSGPLFADPNITHWVRKDLYDAAIAAAKREALSQGIQKAIEVVAKWRNAHPPGREFKALNEAMGALDTERRALLKEDTDQ